MWKDSASPRARYTQHKCNAASRGIGFELSFEQWWALWEPHWEKRGKSAGSMMMCRTGDKGPYAVGNVRIASKKENAQEAALEKLCATGYRTWQAKKSAPNFLHILPEKDLTEDESSEML